MTTPTINAVLARTDGHKPLGWLGYVENTTLVTLQVTAVPVAYPYLTVTVSTVSGDTADITENQEVEVWDSTQTYYKGSLRIAVGALVGTTLNISEHSLGTISVVVGDRLRVKDDYRLREKLVGAVNNFPVDGRLFAGDRMKRPAPLVQSGGHWFGWVDSGESFATVDFKGSGTLNLDVLGGGLTHSWEFGPTATPTTSSAANPTATFPTGQHWISHTVTNSLTGQGYTQRVLVSVYERGVREPLMVELDRVSGQVETGWSASIKLLESADRNKLPDGVMVALFFDDLFAQGAELASRSHIKTIGYLRETRSSTSFDRGNELSMEIVSPIEILSSIPSYSKVFQEAPSSFGWSQTPRLTVYLAVVQSLRYYTTYLDIFDLDLSFDDFRYPILFAQEPSPTEQVRSLVRSRDARLTTNRIGKLMAQHRLDLVPFADRVDYSTIIPLEDQDIIDISWDYVHYRPVRLLELQGFNQNYQPIFSRWPGNAPGGQGQEVDTVDKILATNQAEMNTRVGYWGAARDRVFYTEDGAFYFAPKVSVTLYGQYDFLDFYQYWVEFQLLSENNKRGLGLDLFRWIVQSVDISYDNVNGYATTTVNLLAETRGRDGVTYVPPVDDNFAGTPPTDAGWTDWDFPDFEAGDVGDWVQFEDQNKAIEVIRVIEWGNAPNPSDINPFAPDDFFDNVTGNALCYTCWKYVAMISLMNRIRAQYVEGDTLDWLFSIEDISPDRRFIYGVQYDPTSTLQDYGYSALIDASRSNSSVQTVAYRMWQSLIGQPVSEANFIASVVPDASGPTLIVQELVARSFELEGNYYAFLDELGSNNQRAQAGETLQCPESPIPVRELSTTTEYVGVISGTRYGYLTDFASSVGPAPWNFEGSSFADFQYIEVDPWSPFFTGEGMTVNAYLLRYLAAGYRVYFVEDLAQYNGPRTITEIYINPNPAVSSQTTFTMSKTSQGKLCYCTLPGKGGDPPVQLSYTKDGGDTWTDLEFNEGDRTGSYNNNPSLIYDPRDDRYIYFVRLAANVGSGGIGIVRIDTNDDSITVINPSIIEGSIITDVHGFVLQLRDTDELDVYFGFRAAGAGLAPFFGEIRSDADEQLDVYYPPHDTLGTKLNYNNRVGLGQGIIYDPDSYYKILPLSVDANVRNHIAVTIDNWVNYDVWRYDDMGFASSMQIWSINQYTDTLTKFLMFAGGPTSIYEVEVNPAGPSFVAITKKMADSPYGVIQAAFPIPPPPAP